MRSTQKAGTNGVASQTTNARPASRSRKVAQGGLRTPEDFFNLMREGACDVLIGSIEPVEANAARSMVEGAIMVAKNADTLADMCERASGSPVAGHTSSPTTSRRLAELMAQKRLAEEAVAAADAEMAELQG